MEEVRHTAEDDVTATQSLLAQLADMRALWENEANACSELRDMLSDTDAALSATEADLAQRNELLRCLIAAHRATSPDALCLAVSEHFHRALQAQRVTLFMLDAEENEVWTCINAGGDKFRTPLEHGIIANMMV